MATTASKAQSAINKPDAPPDSLTPAQLRSLESLRDDLNKLYRSASQRLGEIADRLFRELFDGDIKEALSPQKSSSARYRTLIGMCGQSLLLDKVQLSRSIRVGALNAQFKGRAAWEALSWTVKLTLLPLLGPDGDLKRLSAGIAVASKSSATVASVRQWVADHLSDDDKAAGGKPKALSMVAASKILASGRQLKLISARRLLMTRLQRMGKAAVATAISDLDLTIKSLTQLREELSES